MKLACTLAWIKDAVTVNTTFNPTNDKYKLDVQNISQKAADAISKEFGIKVKQDDNKGLHFNAKSKYPFKFIDDAGNPVDPQNIGNGTKAVVDVTGSYSHKFEKQHGKGPVVASVVVIKELVSYTPANANVETEEAL